MKELPESIISKIYVMAFEPHPITKILRNEGVLEFQKYASMFTVIHQDDTVIFSYDMRLRDYLNYKIHMTRRHNLDILNDSHINYMINHFDELDIDIYHYEMIASTFMFNGKIYVSDDYSPSR